MVENMVSKSVKACLLDIEGTTTSISFVKDELFPYILKNVSTYLETHWIEEECQTDITKLLAQALDDRTNSGITVPADIENGTVPLDVKNDLIKYVQWLMSIDSKTTPLKALQGHMWREAYSSGQIKGHLYPDVTDNLQNWHKLRIKLYIYSSGSIEAQKLLFGHSVSGDLTKYFSGHFDTKIGNKRNKESYLDIIKAISCEPCSVLFLTDIVQEARAAKQAGLQVLLVCRPGNTPLSDEDKKEFETINSFDLLTLSLLEEKEATTNKTTPTKRIAQEKTSQAEQ